MMGLGLSEFNTYALMTIASASPNVQILTSQEDNLWCFKSFESMSDHLPL